MKRHNTATQEMLSYAAHELRAPLLGVIGLIEAMLDDTSDPLSSEQAHHLTIIAASCRRLHNLADDMLDLSRLQNNNIELRLQPVDIRRITETTVTLLSPLVLVKPVVLTIDMDDSLPLVMGDTDRLQQIMYNLIGNSVKFTPDGEIIIRGQRKGDWLEVSVIDTGVGISADQISEILKVPVQDLLTVMGTYRGLGLGLIITKHLVMLHGGTLRVESHESIGTQLTFTLPIAHRTQAHLRQQLNGVGPLSEQLRNRSLERGGASDQATILVVDDEPTNRTMLSMYLSAQEFTVIEAENGIQALNIISDENPPDLVLLDVMMPGMSGFEVCRRLRERFMTSELPIIIISARSQSSDLVEGYAAGANDYLCRPFSKRELLARVETHLQLTRNRAR